MTIKKYTIKWHFKSFISVQFQERLGNKATVAEYADSAWKEINSWIKATAVRCSIASAKLKEANFDRR